MYNTENELEVTKPLRGSVLLSVEVVGRRPLSLARLDSY